MLKHRLLPQFRTSLLLRKFHCHQSLPTRMVLRKMPSTTSSGHRENINLLRGWPNTALLPSELLRQAADTVLSDSILSGPAMLYGPDEGDPRLRRETAKWLTEFYRPHLKDAIDIERIAITGGASQNLGCLLQTYTDPKYTRNIWIVSPSYFLAFRIFNDSGFAAKLRAVPEDEEGLDIGYLRRAIEKSEKAAQTNGNSKPVYKVPTSWAKVYKHIIYAVPTFSNPSSKTMSLRRRKELVQLARDFDALIITDDVYDQLQWPSAKDKDHSPLLQAELPRIADIDRYLDGGHDRPDADGFGNTASNGSFSKIAGPGLRTGWCEGSPKFAYGLSQTGTSRSGGCASHIAATFLADTLASGKLQKHVFETLRPAYARRWRKMIAAVEKHLVPLGVRLPQSDRDVVGGYFIWLHLPPRIKASLLARRCKDTVNLVIAEGSMFEVPGDAKLNAWEQTDAEHQEHDGRPAPTAFPYDIRLCFAWEEEHVLEESVERLASVIKSMLEEPEGVNPEVKRKSFGEKQGKSDMSSFW